MKEFDPKKIIQEAKQAYNEHRKAMILRDIKTKFPEISNARVEINKLTGKLIVFGLTEIQLLQLDHTHKL